MIEAPSQVLNFEEIDYKEIEVEEVSEAGPCSPRAAVRGRGAGGGGFRTGFTVDFGSVTLDLLTYVVRLSVNRSREVWRLRSFGSLVVVLKAKIACVCLLVWCVRPKDARDRLVKRPSPGAFRAPGFSFLGYHRVVLSPCWASVDEFHSKVTRGCYEETFEMSYESGTF